MRDLDTRHLSPVTQDAVPQRIVRALREGMSQVEAARVFGVSRRSVNGLHQRWRVRHRQELRLFFLPGYSPELNPDELLNQDVKTNAVGRKRPRDIVELMRHVRRYPWNTQRRPEKARRYFLHPTVRLPLPHMGNILWSP